ncbi:flagellar basal body P-ring formation chaperone FlgA [Aestuariispira ectoiniformans]|uniref:flagellar basal body P-ring formation chaperone FlgA n=1 Tax=Aestuariispira ectoiniformans TaxID=2775080 RepID=UPI00223B5E57|nr:flagellar basal body P-ring formation chaperone FlgA [Aestuariispira ectoiniformans]
MTLIINPTLKRLGAAAIFLAASSAAWGASSTPEPETLPVTLRSSVTVDSDKILLGDVFNGVQNYANRAIAHAPAPGHEFTLKAAWLWRIANLFEVNWKPTSQLDTSTVYRTAVKLTTELQAQKVKEAVEEATADGGLYEIELDNQLSTINLTSDSPASVALANLRLDAARGHFTGTLVAPATGQHQVSIPVSGRIYRMVEVAVPSHRIKRGDIVADQDLQYVQIRANRLTRNALIDASDMVGQSAKHTLQEGRLVSHNDIEPPLLVSRRGILTVTLETPLMRLTVQAKALESGAKGDVIKVENLQSKQLVEAIVTGPNKATVVSPLQSAMR